MELVGYPARIFKDEDDPAGGYLVQFVGLGGGEPWIMTDGESPEDARAMAVECLTGYILSADSLSVLESPRLPEEGEEMVYPDLPVALALTIRRMRATANLSQAEAAKRVGVGQSTYSRWEHPELCNATVDTIQKIARAFGRRVEMSFPEAS